MQKGYIQVYTGNGKGKTTAAMGLALRAVGAGFMVYFSQFMKGQDYSELKSLTLLSDYITHERFGSPEWVYKNQENSQARERALAGLEKVKSIIKSGEYQIVILDEINVTLFFELLSWEEVKSVLQAKPDHVEIICTGRGAPQELLDFADLVTEMKDIKHYYDNGVLARRGIEN